jgi:hypothetical protein
MQLIVAAEARSAKMKAKSEGTEWHVPAKAWTSTNVHSKRLREAAQAIQATLGK